MRAVRFRTGGGAPRIGRVEGNEVVDAGPAPGEGFVPTPEAWAALEQAGGERLPLAELELLHPVVPRKIAGIGLNYRDHAAESGRPLPEVPVVFAMWPSALVGSGTPIVLPYDEPRPDFEGELAIVIGRRVRRASGEAARAAIGGFCAFDDVSGRRAQLETPLTQFTLGKSFDSFCPMGPWLVRADGVDLGDLRVRTVVSGETMQESTTANLIFPPEELVAYCSRATTLEPGDVIATGTPGGVGDSRTPPRYLRPGDVVEVTVDLAGTLRNPVVAEEPAR